MTETWTEERRRFVEDLAGDGYLPDVPWQRAFGDVPRHAFLPRFFKALPDGRWQPTDDTDPDYPALVYADTTLTTQLDGQTTPEQADGPISGTATSSSTQPSLMALMLDALQLAGDERVLEIGTGTGYNAALLCHRLGEESVTSVEVDFTVAAAARIHLAEAGYRPTVVTAEGQDGWPSEAPYDRLIATVSVPAVPTAWLQQVRTGGSVLVSLWRDLGGGPLIRLTVNDGEAQGFFLPQSGGFMPVRNVEKAIQYLGTAIKQTGQTRNTTTASSVLREPHAGLWLALQVPDTTWLGFTPDGGSEQLWLFSPDGSWAAVTDADGSVEQYGPRRLWDEVEAAYQRWERSGRPERDRLGLTITSAGDHRLWLDDPENAVSIAISAS